MRIQMRDEFVSPEERKLEQPIVRVSSESESKVIKFDKVLSLIYTLISIDP
jgi:hypothetical protein